MFNSFVQTGNVAQLCYGSVFQSVWHAILENFHNYTSLLNTDQLMLSSCVHIPHTRRLPVEREIINVYDVFGAGLHFDIATALHLPFRHLAINVATAVERWRHLYKNGSVKIASKNRICGEMRSYLGFFVVKNKGQTQKAVA